MSQSKVNQLTRRLHWQRISWFSFMVSGLLMIQLLQQPLVNILPATTDLSSEALLSATNSYRSKYALPSLESNDQLRLAAEAKAADMIAKNYWSHTTPTGQEPWQFIKDSGYDYQNAGENLAYGFIDGAEVVNAWMDSAGHRANLLGQYSEVGFGLARGDFQGQSNTVVVALYATPVDSGQVAAAAIQQAPANIATSVSNWQSWLSGSLNWQLLLSFAVIATAAIGFGLTHRRLLQHSWESGKHFAAVHPVVDLLIIIGVSIFIASLSSGFIA